MHMWEVDLRERQERVGGLASTFLPSINSPPLTLPAHGFDVQILPPALTHSANSFLCDRISTKPGLVSRTRKGLPT